MANAQIYRKTIDPSVQDGIDQSLILDPSAFYQKKFTFGDDWNEIKVGMFYSYTFSVTDNNMGYSSSGISGDLNSGGTTNDTFSYIGIIKDNPTKYLPNNGLIGPESSFFGHMFNRANFRADLTPNVIDIGGQWLVSSEYISSSPNDYDGVFSLGDDIEETTNFAAYYGQKFKISNKESSTPTLEITRYHAISTGVFTSDISLLNLKNIINSNIGNRHDRNFNLYNGSDTVPIPDSFFFYNAFLTIRPRIHAVAVKKIS